MHAFWSLEYDARRAAILLERMDGPTPGSGASSGGNGRQRRDLAPLGQLLHGEEEQVWTDAGYCRIGKRAEHAHRELRGRLEAGGAEGQGAGGASVPDRQAGVRLRHGSLSRSGEERPEFAGPALRGLNRRRFNPENAHLRLSPRRKLTGAAGKGSFRSQNQKTPQIRGSLGPRLTITRPA